MHPTVHTNRGFMRLFTRTLALLLLLGTVSWAMPLGTNTRAIIPSDIQQIISVDYRALRASDTAMQLKQQVLPESLKQFEQALKAVGIDADMITGVDSGPVWSVLDQQGTQNMLRSALGDASKLADYETLKKRLLGSRYVMNFASGVNFDLDVITSDSMTAATLSSLLKAGVMYKKMNATPVEKVAMDSLTVDSDSSKLQLHFKTDDKKFQSLMHSDLFAAVSR